MLAEAGSQPGESATARGPRWRRRASGSAGGPRAACRPLHPSPPGPHRGPAAARHYQTCTLRTLPKYTQRINKVHRRGIVSGAPFNWDQPHSLFCFALARPGTYEVGLLKLQYKKQWSIFGCDEFQVVSNETWHFVPGVVTSPIVSNLHCEVEIGVASGGGGGRMWEDMGRIGLLACRVREARRA